MGCYERFLLSFWFWKSLSLNIWEDRDTLRFPGYLRIPKTLVFQIIELRSDGILSNCYWTLSAFDWSANWSTVAFSRMCARFSTESCYLPESRASTFGESILMVLFAFLFPMIWKMERKTNQMMMIQRVNQFRSVSEPVRVERETYEFTNQ